MNYEAMQSLIERSKAVLSQSLKGTQGVALVAALVPLGSLATQTARALTEIGPEYSSRVDAVLEDMGGGVTRYHFTVVNTTSSYFGIQDPNGYGFVIPQIVNWELPSFTDPTSIIFNIQSPTGWEYEILYGATVTTLYYNNANGPYGQYVWSYDPNQDPQVDANGGNNPYPLPFSAYDAPPFLIHWYTIDMPESSPANPINPLESLSGFSFDTLVVGSENSPYSSSWFFLPLRLGDPPVPGNQNSGVVVPSAFVPEPGSMLLLAGVGAMSLVRRRRV